MNTFKSQTLMSPLIITTHWKSKTLILHKFLLPNYYFNPVKVWCPRLVFLPFFISTSIFWCTFPPSFKVEFVHITDLAVGTVRSKTNDFKLMALHFYWQNVFFLENSLLSPNRATWLQLIRRRNNCVCYSSIIRENVLPSCISCMWSANRRTYTR